MMVEVIVAKKAAATQQSGLLLNVASLVNSTWETEPSMKQGCLSVQDDLVYVVSLASSWQRRERGQQSFFFALASILPCRAEVEYELGAIGCSRLTTELRCQIGCL